MVINRESMYFENYQSSRIRNNGPLSDAGELKRLMCLPFRYIVAYNKRSIDLNRIILSIPPNFPRTASALLVYSIMTLGLGSSNRVFDVSMKLLKVEQQSFPKKKTTAGSTILKLKHIPNIRQYSTLGLLWRAHSLQPFPNAHKNKRKRLQTHLPLPSRHRNIDKPPRICDSLLRTSLGL